MADMEKVRVRDAPLIARQNKLLKGVIFQDRSSCSSYNANVLERTRTEYPMTTMPRLKTRIGCLPLKNCLNTFRRTTCKLHSSDRVHIIAVPHDLHHHPPSKTISLRRTTSKLEQPRTNTYNCRTTPPLIIIFHQSSTQQKLIITCVSRPR